jgi:tRNA pseudouridine-54 N-methylase
VALHVVLLGLPASQRKTSASSLVLQVLLQENTSLLGSALVQALELIEKSRVVSIPGLIVGENRAVVGVSVVQIPLLGECPDWVLWKRS